VIPREQLDKLPSGDGKPAVHHQNNHQPAGSRSISLDQLKKDSPIKNSRGPSEKNLQDLRNALAEVSKKNVSAPEPKPQVSQKIEEKPAEKPQEKKEEPKKEPVKESKKEVPEEVLRKILDMGDDEKK
jgi:hypothetical protein